MSLSSIYKNNARLLRLGAAGVLLTGLAGCVNAEKPTLSADARQSLKLTGVSVDFAPNANIYISPVEDEVHARGSYEREQVSEASKAQIRKVMPEEFTVVVGPRLAGSHPVAAHITVTSFDVPGPLNPQFSPAVALR